MHNADDRLLLIEGDSSKATTVLEALKGQGQPRVEWAKGLSDGLRRLGHPGVIAILVNLFLPDSRGVETLDRVRVAAGHIPILVLCRADHGNIGSLAVAHGADDFIAQDHLDSYSLTCGVSRVLERHTKDDATAH
jgi:DNA-binding response OmpR family regulator